MNTVTHVQVQFHYHNFCHQSLHFRFKPVNKSFPPQTACLHWLFFSAFLSLLLFFRFFALFSFNCTLPVFKCTLNTHTSHHTNIIVHINSCITQLSMQMTLSSRNLWVPPNKPRARPAFTSCNNTITHVNTSAPASCKHRHILPQVFTSR